MIVFDRFTLLVEFPSGRHMALSTALGLAAGPSLLSRELLPRRSDSRPTIGRAGTACRPSEVSDLYARPLDSSVSLLASPARPGGATVDPPPVANAPERSRRSGVPQ